MVKWGLPGQTIMSTQLSWMHFVEILSIEDLRKRDFYAKMCRIERWSVSARCGTKSDICCSNAQPSPKSLML